VTASVTARGDAQPPGSSDSRGAKRAESAGGAVAMRTAFQRARPPSATMSVMRVALLSQRARARASR